LDAIVIRKPAGNALRDVIFFSLNMQQTPREVLVLHGAQPEASDRNFMKLAEFLGVPCRCEGLAKDSASLFEGIARQSLGGTSAVCISARTLAKCVEASADTAAGANRTWMEGHLFVYGFAVIPEHFDLIRRLSHDALNSIRELDSGENEYTVDADSKWLCQEFSGLTFRPANRGNDLVFQKATGDSPVQEDVRIGGNPFLVTIQDARTFTMLAGTREILDIDAPVAPGVRPLDWFSRLVPALMFLRHALGDRCWQAGKKLACFILDDPLLRPRYGFLEYAALLESMRRENFAASVAFIPWNYRRSQRKVIQLFHANPERLSLSIHGCDHTKGEFGEADEVLLSRKAVTAHKRLVRHRDLTRVPFDRVMVFPQGIFSSAALRALKTNNYLAAVNSTPFSVDDPPHRLRVRDLLSPAVMAYGGFPLFVRHYPNRIAEFALDLFLGKPALIVEHHDYFRSGYENIQDFARQINALSEDITWCRLEEIVRNVCLVRRCDNGRVERRFYCNEDRVESGGGSLNGGCDSTIGNDELRFGSRRYRMAVSVRRRLSEFRDNYVSRSRIAMAAVRALRSEPKDSSNPGRLEQSIISTTPKPVSGGGQE
jgi:hypothetical protein